MRIQRKYDEFSDYGSWPCYVRNPDHWRGRTVEVFSDGAVLLDSGLFSKERKDAGNRPLFTLLIKPDTSGQVIRRWVLQRLNEIQPREDS